MCEPDILFDMPVDSYAWPETTIVTRPDGVAMQLAPASSTPVAVNRLDHSKVGECFQYTSQGQSVSELEVLIWHDEKTYCNDVAEIIGGNFDKFCAETLTCDFIIRELEMYGYTRLCVFLNLKWMIQCGQLLFLNGKKEQKFQLYF